MTTKALLLLHTIVILTLPNMILVCGFCFREAGPSYYYRHHHHHHHHHHHGSIIRKYFPSQKLYLNRLLFDPEEVDYETNSVTLSKDDYRTIHAAKILGLENGATVRAGIVSDDNYNYETTKSTTEEEEDDDNHHQHYNNNNGRRRGGLLTDQAVIEWIPEGKVKKKGPLGNGKPPGSMKIHFHNAIEPTPQQQATSTTTTSSVALLLALPRPLALGRMLPMISQMGVSHLLLSQAKKVPKDYFGSHLFRKPHALRERLIEGLCQSGTDVQLPKVQIIKNLKHYLEDELDEQFPLDEYARVIAHPQRLSVQQQQQQQPENNNEKELRMRDIQFPTANNNDDNNNITTTPPRRILLAVGPEGGWEEPDELDRFQRYNFQQITLGTRVLRSDCAVVSLLALAHDACLL